jgi:hypothetical protein
METKMDYDTLLEFYRSERIIAKEQSSFWQKRLSDLEQALTELMEAKRIYQNQQKDIDEHR